LSPGGSRKPYIYIEKRPSGSSEELKGFSRFDKLDLALFAFICLARSTQALRQQR
jgi:hypothetical protein